MRTSPIRLENFVGSRGLRFSEYGAKESDANEIDVEAIERDAFARGVEKGRSDAEAERAAIALEEAATKLTAISLELNQAISLMETQRLQYLEQVLSSLLPSMATSAFPTEAAHLIERLVSEIATGGGDPCILRVRAPEDAINELSELIDDAGAAGHVGLFPDPSLATGEVEIGWDQGGASLDLNGVVSSVLAALRQEITAQNEGARDEK